jgi:hypothetical protein
LNDDVMMAVSRMKCCRGGEYARDASTENASARDGQGASGQSL